MSTAIEHSTDSRIWRASSIPAWRHIRPYRPSRRFADSWIDQGSGEEKSEMLPVVRRGPIAEVDDLGRRVGGYDDQHASRNTKRIPERTWEAATATRELPGLGRADRTSSSGRAPPRLQNMPFCPPWLDAPLPPADPPRRSDLNKGNPGCTAESPGQHRTR